MRKKQAKSGLIKMRTSGLFWIRICSTEMILSNPIFPSSLIYRRKINSRFFTSIAKAKCNLEIYLLKVLFINSLAKTKSNSSLFVVSKISVLSPVHQFSPL